MSFASHRWRTVSALHDLLAWSAQLIDTTSALVSVEDIRDLDRGERLLGGLYILGGLVAPAMLVQPLLRAAAPGHLSTALRRVGIAVNGALIYEYSANPHKQRRCTLTKPQPPQAERVCLHPNCRTVSTPEPSIQQLCRFYPPS